MMLSKGFAISWIDKVMMCISSVCYCVLINGKELSIGAEGLSTLFKSKEELGLIHGCKIPRKAPPVSHIFFADDSMLFFRASLAESA